PRPSPELLPPGDAQLGAADAAPSARAPAPVRLAAAERNRARPGFARAGPQRSSVARNTGFIRKTAAPGLKLVESRAGGLRWNRTGCPIRPYPAPAFNKYP